MMSYGVMLVHIVVAIHYSSSPTQNSAPQEGDECLISEVYLCVLYLEFCSNSMQISA